MQEMLIIFKPFRRPQAQNARLPEGLTGLAPPSQPMLGKTSRSCLALVCFHFNPQPNQQNTYPDWVLTLRPAAWRASRISRYNGSSRRYDRNS